MPVFICKTCGAEHAESAAPPSNCIICDDERQYIGWQCQQWVTADDIKVAGHRNEVMEEEPGLTGVGITPQFSIGQRALLVQTGEGNIVYDCVSLLDDEAIDAIKALGGIQGICFSHPHFYEAMVTYSHTFGNAPIYIPEADKEFVTRPDAAVRYWDGQPLKLLPGVTLIQTGGHFPGGAVLHWADGAEGKAGAVCWRYNHCSNG